jgi:uncharacterized membrane protein
LLLQLDLMVEEQATKWLKNKHEIAFKAENVNQLLSTKNKDKWPGILNQFKMVYQSLPKTENQRISVGSFLWIRKDKDKILN